jgi:hypothetical protein
MTMNARTQTARVIHYFDTAGQIADATLLVGSVVDASDTEVAALTMTEVASTPDLLLSNAITLSQTGQYTVKWTYDGTLLSTEQLIVGFDHNPNQEPGAEGDLRYYFDEGETVTALIVDSTGTVVGSAESATYSADLLGYEVSDYVFALPGDYFIIWRRSVVGQAVPVQVDHWFVYTPRNRFSSSFTLTTEDGGTAHEAVRILVSESDGTPVVEIESDAAGQASTNLNPGSYVVTLKKTGVVFDINNWVIEVVDPLLDDAGNNVFNFQQDVFLPTFATNTPPSALATLFLNLFDMQGRPFVGAQVLVTLVGELKVFGSNTLWDTSQVFKTDASGHVEFPVVQGVELEVQITPLNISRRFTVPESAGPHNIGTLAANADDPFDILAVVTTTAPRRTL